MKAVKYWPEARLILVRSEAPYFQISTVKQFARTGKLYPLEQDRYIKVGKDIVRQYSDLVAKYCVK